jgi:hypothetical protein
MEEYVLVRWAESQHLMEQEWFDECILAIDIESSAYFVPKERYNSLINKKVKVYITVRGGVVESVGSNTNIKYCIVDYDNKEYGNNIWGILDQDYISKHFHDEFEDKKEIRDKLIKLDF